MKKTICFIAQFPPPIHGLSKAVDTLYNSALSEEYEFEKVNITNNKNILKNLILILTSKADLFYFTISQTKEGNFRDLLILTLLSLQKKKCLIHLHGGYYRKLIDNDLPSWQQSINYKAISRLAGAIVLGNSLKSIFKDLLPDDKIFIVPNCVDDEYLMSDKEFEEKTTTLGNQSVKHVLYLSNFIRTKGYLEVLELAQLERKRCVAGGERKFHFDFAGKFFEETEEMLFFSYIEKYQLVNYITYHGVVEGEKKRELLKKCDIFTLLTRYPNEGQPISILEAMGNGMMIVTTNHAGIPDIVEDGINGMVMKKNTLNMHICYQHLLENVAAIDEFQRIITTNRNNVLLQYNQNTYVNNVGKCMQRMLKE